jgi:hypothetical protein
MYVLKDVQHPALRWACRIYKTVIEIKNVIKNFNVYTGLRLLKNTKHMMTL